jgi:PcRGLX-like N-terminal RIFT barrel domain
MTSLDPAKREAAPRYPSRAATPKRGSLFALLLATAAAAQAPPAPPARTPLCHVTARESADEYRAREPLSFGVPIARAALPAADAARLRVWREADGAPLPAQARAQSFWPDGSVKWALVDTQLELQALQNLRLVVGLAPDVPEAPSPFKFSFDKDAGRAFVEDGTTRWPLLERRKDGDAVLGLRPWLVDRFNHIYRAQLDSATLKVEQDGPLRWSLRVEGVHKRADEDGLPIDFHDFVVHADLLAGTGTARVEWTLRNGPLQDPPGALGFHSYELLLDAEGATSAAVPGSLDGAKHDFALRQDGAGVGDFSYVADGKALGVSQPSDLWCGLLDADPAHGLWVHREDSAHNHPASLWWQAGGPLHIGLLPNTKGTTYWLDDAQQKTFRLTLARDVGRAGRGLVVQACRPVHVLLDPQDVAASGAWGDTGAFYVPSLGEMREPPPAPKEPRDGWVDWGEWNVRNTHAAGSPRNRLSVFLEAVQSGSVDAYDLAVARARHAMDIRPFHIAGFSADKFPHANLYEGTPHPNEPPENRLGRSEMDAKFPEYKAGLPPDGHGYNGCESEHMTLDDIYEDWLLTGDPVARESLAQVGEAMLTWHTVMPGFDLHSARSFGWTLRALVQVYRATGDKRFLDACRGMVARGDEHRGKGDVKYFRAGPPDARHIPDKASESSWMVSVALHGLAAYWSETQDPLVPPMARDLSAFILSAYRGADGFISDIPCDGSPPKGTATQAGGTSQWIPGGLAAAAAITGDYGPVDKVYDYYRAMRTRKGSARLRFGSEGWHWWQDYLVALQRRYGEAAVQGAEGFTPTGK